MEFIESENIKMEIVEQIPKLVFIVPYRDRVQHQAFFKRHMKMILEDMPETDYKIYYIHQCDNREFNRGAMKNIGFLVIKEKYPNDYKNITLVFNDVDVMPFTKDFLNYDTTEGVVKHFYGYTFCLGGLFSIKGGDFEKISGFPNLWAWGYEDNLIQRRALKANLTIDRSNFYPIMDKNICHLKDGFERTINRREFDRVINDTDEGFQSINTLNYSINEETGFVNVTNFFTAFQESIVDNVIHDIRKGSAFLLKNNIRGRPRPRIGMGIGFK
jgi:hypothetical protein